MSAITWNALSLRDIARQMAALGFGWSKDTVARLMHEDGYSLHHELSWKPILVSIFNNRQNAFTNGVIFETPKDFRVTDLSRVVTKDIA